MTEVIVALDQGTSSSRAIAFDHSGRVVCQAQQEFPQIYPADGCVEHDPLAIWQSQLDCLKKVLSNSKITVKALGITNQRETTLLWNKKDGKPIHNAIVWQDRRTTTYCEDLKTKGYEKLINQKTGLLLDSYFSATKIVWLLENVEGAKQLAKNGDLAFGTVDSWLIWQLTGGKTHCTDITNASRTMLFNIHQASWDDELLDLFQIPKSILPKVVSNSELIADTDPNVTGESFPISGCAGDQHAALFGQMAISRGMVKNTYGTGCFAMLNTGDEPISSQNKLLTTIAWRIKDQTTYALEGSVFVAGALIQWLRDELKFIDKAANIQSLAESVKDSSGVSIVPAFVGLGAPHWNPHARGLICGLTRSTKPAHIARAALEAIALQSLDLIETMRKDSGIEIKELRVDGGASENDLLMQLQADLIDGLVTRPTVLETTALGAAYFSGLAVGFWKNTDELKNLWRKDRNFAPKLDSDERDKIVDRWNHALRMANTN